MENLLNMDPLLQKRITSLVIFFSGFLFQIIWVGGFLFYRDNDKFTNIIGFVSVIMFLLVFGVIGFIFCILVGIPLSFIAGILLLFDLSGGWHGLFSLFFLFNVIM